MDWAWWTSLLVTPISRFIGPRLLFMRISEEPCYAALLDSDEGLITRTSEPAARMRENSSIFELVRQSLHRRCQACAVVCYLYELVPTSREDDRFGVMVSVLAFRSYVRSGR
ncbi:hypothetical protein TNCV_2149551 [Trichonephila clavipes]|nr:hypothetical protein TNCV_2149551 [Trichonephila clavipes]